jgi:uncharacterized membrane protein YgcG
MQFVAPRFRQAAAAVTSPLPLGGPATLVPFVRPGKHKLGSVQFLRSSIVGKRLYVGNLSFNVTSQALEELFAQFGNVESAQVVQDRDTGRSKGFGFVEMGDENAAQEAIRGLHEKEHDGRPLTVNEARPREERGGGGGGGRRGGGGGGYGGGGGGGGRGGYGGGGRR